MLASSLPGRGKLSSSIAASKLLVFQGKLGIAT
jgi:hypothetical protein